MKWKFWREPLTRAFGHIRTHTGLICECWKRRVWTRLVGLPHIFETEKVPVGARLGADVALRAVLFSWSTSRWLKALWKLAENDSRLDKPTTDFYWHQHERATFYESSPIHLTSASTDLICFLVWRLGAVDASLKYWFAGWPTQLKTTVSAI